VVYAELYNTANPLLDGAAYRLANMLSTLGYRALFFPREGYGVIAALAENSKAAFSRVLAARFAGLGTIGANHCLLTPEYGPRVRFVSVITGAETEADPLPEDELCIQCGRCRQNCPVKAFTPVPNSVIADMDRYKCARYHRLLRKEMRYPCGVCTLVCPVGKDRKVYGGASLSGEGVPYPG
jgi:O-acetylhomoserine (thiol)-lyase